MENSTVELEEPPGLSDIVAVERISESTTCNFQIQRKIVRSASSSAEINKEKQIVLNTLTK